MPSEANAAFDERGSDHEFERRLSVALDGTVRTLPPLPPGLLEGAARRGRRRRMWHAAQAGGGALLAVAALGGTLVGTGVLGSATSAPGPREIGPAAAGGSTPVVSRKAPAPSVSPAEMAATLRRLMPKGGTVSDASGTPSSARLRYTSGQRTSGIDLSIKRIGPDLPRSEEVGGCMPVEVRPYDTCETTRYPDGSMLYATKSFTYPSSDAGQRRWYVELATADGADLFLEEFGGGDEKGSTGTADPVLSIAQLTSIVRSPAWQKAIDALPAPPSELPPAVPSRNPTAERMTSLLTSLLPAEGTLSDVSSDAGSVQLVYDDGHGKNMVELAVQPQSLIGRHMGCEGHLISCESQVLKDGTKVKIARVPNEKGGSAVVWTVDTLRKDGIRVVVRECNSYAEAGPVTRAKPALSLARLRAIALDPRWLG